MMMGQDTDLYAQKFGENLVNHAHHNPQSLHYAAGGPTQDYLKQ
jgi:hypothetical protein